MNNQDIRVVRTLGLIRGAFLQLLEEKGFEAMTVQDILDKTRINRSTFYKHFANKNEVAKVIVEEIKALARERLKQRFSVPTKEFIYGLEPLFEEHRKLIYLIGQIETPKIHLYNDIHHMVKAKYIEHLRNKPAQSDNDKDLDFQGHLFATVTLGVIKHFIEKGEMPQAEALIRNINTVFELLIIRGK